MITEFTESQIEEIKEAKALIAQAATKLQKVDTELFALGSFPESPVGHTAWGLENTSNYLQGWLHDGGVEIN